MADWQSWIASFRSRDVGLSKPVAANRRKPAFESLEDRLTPTAPTVLSIAPTAPIGPNTSLTSVTFTATFNETVTGVDAADFKIVASGSVLTAPAPVVTGSGATYSVTVNGIHGNGELRVDLIDNDSIQSVNGTLGDTGPYNGSIQSRSIQILQTFPTVLSINRTSPTSAATSASSVTFTVTFSADVTGVDAADFSPLATSGTVVGTISSVTPVSNSIYVVTVSGITGEGTLGLNLIANGTIRDAIGNPLGSGTAPVSFSVQSIDSGGQNPYGLAFADVNADGKADLSTTIQSSGVAGVLLGVGDGSFLSQQTYAAGPLSRVLVVADVNGDGKPDYAVANSASAVGAGILLGNGDGTFQPQIGYETGNNARSVAVGDLNGDGKPDLALANYLGNSISILLGNGDGTFRPQQTFAAGGRPRSISIADLNGDGKADLMVANSFSANLGVFWGVGDGTFQAQQTFAAEVGPTSGIIADLNSDGILDMAAVNQASRTLSVLLGAGGGAFQPQQTFATGVQPFGLSIGDVNGDGKLDAIVANANSDSIGVFLGDGNGSFLAQQTIATASGPFTTALGDINGDGRLDMAVTNYYQGTYGVYTSTFTFVGQAYTIDHIAPTVTILSVTPDPRNTPVGLVTINFSEAVQNFDISDLTLTRGGVPVALSAAQLTGSGPQYTLDLAAATGSGTLPILGDYVLTLNASDIADPAGFPLVSGASESWQIVSFATTTALTATPNATTGGTLVTFTATVSPSPGTVGSVTFRDNGVTLVGAANVPLVDGVATFQTSILAVGSHPVIAEYNPVTGYLGSTSNPAGVDVSPSAPQIVSVTPNANIAPLAGTQRSRVASLVVVFNQPVQLDPGAMTLALHTNSVAFDGVARPGGFGTLPTDLVLNTTDNVTWIVTFSGNTESTPDPLDGFKSIKDGVYDLNIAAALVHPLGVPAVNMAANSTTTFHRLFGDFTGASTPDGGVANVDFETVTNTSDNFILRGSFNNPANYRASFDFDGDGSIGTSDNLPFRNRFNRPLSWKV